MITIITPAYEVTPVMKACVEGVRNNTVSEYKHILVYNHPPYEGLKEYLYEQAEKDPNITLVDDDKNYGCFGAIAHCSHMVETEYMVKLDADVIVPKNWDLLLAEALEKVPQLGYISAYMDRFMGISCWRYVPHEANGITFTIVEADDNHAFPSTSCVLFRREVWEHYKTLDPATIPLYDGEEIKIYHKAQELGYVAGHLPTVVCQHLTRSRWTDQDYTRWKDDLIAGKTKLDFNTYKKVKAPRRSS